VSAAGAGANERVHFLSALAASEIDVNRRRVVHLYIFCVHNATARSRHYIISLSVVP
jgi:hypothetical protein